MHHLDYGGITQQATVRYRASVCVANIIQMGNFEEVLHCFYRKLCTLLFIVCNLKIFTII